MLPELQRGFDTLEERRIQLLERYSRVEEKLLSYHPAPGSWSMLQVAQHLVLVEELIVGSMTKPDRPLVRRKWWHRIGAWLLSIILTKGLRVPAPTKRVVPVDERPLDDTARRWQAVRDRLHSFLEAVTPESSGRLGMRHPLSGPHDVPATLEFIRSHFDHHLRQLARIDASAAQAGLLHRAGGLQ